MIIDDWKAIIGEDNIICEPAELKRKCKNVSGLTRKITAILYPSSTEDVREIVKIANHHKQPLYAISTGKNWGLGSHLPVVDNCAIVELSRMNRIIEVNTTHGYVVLEPGVTQKQLSDFLIDNNLPFIFNVTGASPNSSIIGNAMDRGIGFYSARVDQISGLEIVLGNGEILRTGFGHYSNSRITHLYRHGIGPSLDGVFSQSNFGIVTAAGFELLHKKENMEILTCSIFEDDLVSKAVDELAVLCRQGIVDSSIHIADPGRAEISAMPMIHDYFVENKGMSEEKARTEAKVIYEKELKRSWSIWGGLNGTRVQVREAKKRLKIALRPFGKVRFLTTSRISLIKKILRLFQFIPTIQRKLILINSLEPVINLPTGRTTEKAIKSIYWPLGPMPEENWTEPDMHDCGLLYVLPIIPLEGSALLEMLKTTRVVSSQFEFVPYITTNIIDGKALECVINIAFDKKSKERTQDAHRCIRELNIRFRQCGFIPYRLGISFMDELVQNEDSYWHTIRALKNVFDPQNVISPGRYNLQ